MYWLTGLHKHGHYWEEQTENISNSAAKLHSLLIINVEHELRNSEVVIALAIKGRLYVDSRNAF